MAEADIGRAAAIGSGVIGAGWVARLRLRGVDVRVFDPADDVAEVLDEVFENARRVWRQMELEPPSGLIGSATICDSIAEACAGAELVVESVPERIEVKHATLTAIDTAREATTIIASSTSGFRPSVLAEPLERPERLIVAHPFNPVYLLPLVELVGGTATSNDVIERARSIYQSIGMHPLHVRAEIDAHIADRLLEAVWREAL